ncbi:DsbA family protein [Carnobacteriaceae bacterium zg-ZUI252]|nr:DsbA family protein [Carnobacteriaceae bacterium zg-ZUI252]
MSTLDKKENNTYASSVLDVYLFVNPIDTFCHCNVNQLITAMSCKPVKTYFHIIPYQNQEIIDRYIKAHQLPLTDLTLRKNIMHTTQTITRLFKAATCQGKKKARLFLYHLNPYTQAYGHQLTNEMMLNAAKKANLDIDMLISDAHSQTVSHLIEKDLKMAKHYTVSRAPSVIIFDSLCDDGILLENTVSVDDILYAVQSNVQFKIK